MELIDTPVVVLGAGLSGLSAGYQLGKNRILTLLIEEKNSVGGLAKSIGKDGFIFDLGGHRLHTKKEAILKEIKVLLGDDLLMSKRKSRIFLQGKFYDYPLKPASAIFSFGPVKSVEILISYLSTLLRGKFEESPEESFEDWVKNRFGNVLYTMYFKPYTEKIWGISTKEISKDWASKRIDLINLWDALKKAVFKSGVIPKTYIQQFYYPSKGIGMIAQKMAEQIKQENSQIMLGTKVVKIITDGDMINSVIISKDNQHIRLKANHFICTIPLTDVISMIEPIPPVSIFSAVNNLKYKAIICLFLIINKNRISDDTWLYFPGKDIIFSRVNEPKNWSRGTVPTEDKTSLCLQIFCEQNDQIWKAQDKELMKKAIQNLIQIGFLRTEEVIDYFVERIPYAYPVFQVGYDKYLEKTNQFLSQFKNLYIIGRTGSFSYLNMDEVIEEGMELAGRITATLRQSYL